MKGRLVLACVRCHLDGVETPAAGVVGPESLCADHLPPKVRHLRLVPFCGEDLVHGHVDGWVE